MLTRPEPHKGEYDWCALGHNDSLDSCPSHGTRGRTDMFRYSHTTSLARVAPVTVTKWSLLCLFRHLAKFAFTVSWTVAIFFFYSADKKKMLRPRASKWKHNAGWKCVSSILNWIVSLFEDAVIVRIKSRTISAKRHDEIKFALDYRLLCEQGKAKQQQYIQYTQQRVYLTSKSLRISKSWTGQINL